MPAATAEKRTEITIITAESAGIIITAARITTRSVRIMTASLQTTLRAAARNRRIITETTEITGITGTTATKRITRAAVRRSIGMTVTRTGPGRILLQSPR